MAKENSTVGPHNTLVCGTVVKGDIFTENDIRIDGTLEGNLTCKGKVVIGNKGLIKGNIDCDSAEIMGTLNGEISVADKLVVQSTGKIEGNISTSVLVIEPNAFFCGSCTMEKKNIKE